MDGDRRRTQQIICASHHFPQMQRTSSPLFYLILSCSLHSFQYKVGKHSRGVFPRRLFASSPPRNHSFRLAHICPAVCLVPSWRLGPSPFFSGPPASWLQPLIPPSSFAPSACCQNCPHQSGTPAPWTPVPIRLSSGTLYPFAFLSLFVLVDLFGDSSSFCRRFTCAWVFVSSLHVLCVFVQSHVGSVSIANHTHSCSRPVFIWVFKHH